MSFRVGDKVALLSLGQGPELCRVDAVTEQYVQIDDGTRWTHQGTAYPTGDETCTERHDLELELRQLRRVARNLMERLGEPDVDVERDIVPIVQELEGLIRRRRAKDRW